MNVLHVDSSARGNASASRQLTAAIATAIRQRTPGAQVTYRDLVADPIGHMDGVVLEGLRPGVGAAVSDPDDVAREAVLSATVLDEFLDADVVVIGAPMYNFSVPTQLKAWIDRLAQAGRTFRYTAKGPEGLAGGKHLIIVSSRGGKYAGQPFEVAMDHQEAYLRAVFGFFGIADVTVIRAEGVAMGPDAQQSAVEQALGQLAEVSDQAHQALARAADRDSVAAR